MQKNFFYLNKSSRKLTLDISPGHFFLLSFRKMASFFDDVIGGSNFVHRFVFDTES